MNAAAYLLAALGIAACAILAAYAMRGHIEHLLGEITARDTTIAALQAAQRESNSAYTERKKELDQASAKIKYLEGEIERLQAEAAKKYPDHTLDALEEAIAKTLAARQERARIDAYVEQIRSSIDPNADPVEAIYQILIDLRGKNRDKNGVRQPWNIEG